MLRILLAICILMFCLLIIIGIVGLVLFAGILGFVLLEPLFGASLSLGIILLVGVGLTILTVRRKRKRSSLGTIKTIAREHGYSDEELEVEEEEDSSDFSGGDTEW